MFFVRKVYETRSQKVGDFFLGIGLFIAVNVAFGLISALGASIIGTIGSGVSDSSAFQAFWSLMIFLLYALPYAVQIGLLIYFGLTRYWIALGMLGAFAASLLLVLLFVAFCFALLSGFGHSG